MLQLRVIGIAPRTGVGKTRHIQARWLWIRDCVQAKTIRIVNVPRAANPADLGTNILEQKRHA